VDIMKTSAHLRFAALLLPVGPAAVGVLRYVLPYDTTDGSSTVVTKVLAHPQAESAVVWLGLLAALTLVPGVLAAGQLTRDGAHRLTTAALLLVVPGYLALNVMLSGDLLLAAGTRAGTGSADLTRLYGHAHPVQDIATTVFVVGHVLGTVLLGIALLHSHVVPRWAGWLVAISQPVHFLAAVALGNHPLDFAAWLMTAAGMAAVAVVWYRATGAERPVEPALSRRRAPAEPTGAGWTAGP
jgi:hypothetical protein